MNKPNLDSVEFVRQARSDCNFFHAFVIEISAFFCKINAVFSVINGREICPNC